MFFNLRSSLISAFVLLNLFFVMSCSHEVQFREVGKIDCEVNFLRLDSLMNSFKNAPDSLVMEQLGGYLDSHSVFIEAYNTNIIKVGSAFSKNYNSNLQAFLHYPFYDELQVEVNKKFLDISKLKSDISTSFSRFKSIYPEIKTPKVYFYNGGFNQSVVLVEDGVGVGLDKYLGVNCSFYPQMGMQNFLIEKMYPEKIHSDLVLGYLQGEFLFNFKDENLLANMIHSGRIMYLTKCLMQEEVDSILWGYSQKDFEFLENSEDDMWMYLVDNKLLFDSDYMTITKMIGEGPFTSFFSKESPSRTGVWLGFRIVCAYMERNEKVTINELMSEADYQKIMNKSRYNP